ncbi:MAG: hypothetical protein O7D30_06385, partial [Rickettsia endosymbiont of Ixodes persulcatus]|nr:hypothetical protein [Rickettsia endosymbiont of Ixodes persulcatus]
MNMKGKNTFFYINPTRTPQCSSFISEIQQFFVWRPFFLFCFFLTDGRFHYSLEANNRGCFKHPRETSGCNSMMTPLVPLSRH